jgi:tetratricopeptide (TPR) repeat protein
MRAKALNADGRLAWRCGDYEGAKQRFAKSLELWRTVNDKAGLANALNGLGRAAVNLGNYAAARAWITEGLAHERELGNKPGVALCINTLGEIARSERRISEAETFYEESLAIFREIGDSAQSVSMLHDLGYTALAADEDGRSFRAGGARLDGSATRLCVRTPGHWRSQVTAVDRVRHLARWSASVVSSAAFAWRRSKNAAAAHECASSSVRRGNLVLTGRAAPLPHGR